VTHAAPSPRAAVTPEPPVDCGEVRCLALTFDDGPGAATGRLLDTLARHGARATFFTVGVNAAARPDLVDRMRADGHLVGNHTWSHRDLTAMPQDKVTAQLSRCQNAVTGATGAAPAVMRAPYGAADGKVSAAARGLGLAIVGWDVDPRDETKRDPAAIARAVIDQVGRLAKGGTTGGARRGAIVLLHDTNAATVAAMPRVLSELGERGYKFVTVPELYGSARLAPGRTYDPVDATRYSQ
jgi:peptidoglycan/xylan/chitin deacetylase (PgdA/CDA1 family)